MKYCANLLSTFTFCACVSSCCLQDKRWYLHFNYGYGGDNNAYFLSRREYACEGSMFVISPSSYTLEIFSGGDPTVPNDVVYAITQIHPAQ